MLLEQEICGLCWHDTVVRSHKLHKLRQWPFLPFSSQYPQICYNHKVFCDPCYLSLSLMKVFMFPHQSLNLRRGSQVFRNSDFHIQNVLLALSLEQNSTCQEDIVCTVISVILFIFKKCQFVFTSYQGFKVTLTIKAPIDQHFTVS